MRRISIIGLAIWSVSSAAMADGMPAESYKDTPTAYHYSAPRSSYSEGRRSSIREYLSASEMATVRCFKANAQRRQEGRSRDCMGYTRRESLVSEARYERRRPYREEYTETRSSQCKAMIDVTGHERTGRGRAEQSALNAWRTAASDRYGFQYAGVENAKGNTRPSCVKVRGDVFGVFVCSLRARPCRGY